MKGRSGYASGGKMRDIGGVKAPAYGTNDKITAEAKDKTVGIVGNAGIGADGLPAKKRLDRPGRNMGGMSKKGC